MSDLLMRQQEFAAMLPTLLQFIIDNGYQYTLGDAYRDKRCPYGNRRSLHNERLAIDLNLFTDGRFLQSSEDHKIIGEYWESLGGSWGGRFNDGNHYSLSFNGMK